MPRWRDVFFYDFRSLSWLLGCRNLNLILFTKNVKESKSEILISIKLSRNLSVLAYFTLSSLSPRDLDIFLQEKYRKTQHFTKWSIFLLQICLNRCRSTEFSYTFLWMNSLQLNQTFDHIQSYGSTQIFTKNAKIV